MNEVLGQTGLLLKNDLRLMLRSIRGNWLATAAGTLLIGFGLLFLHGVSIALFVLTKREPAIQIQVVAWAFFAFTMLGTAMANAIRLFFEQADFDLLFGSPISPRAVLLSRILTMILGCCFSTAIFVLPLINGIAIGVSWHFLASYLVWLSLATIMAAVGTGIALGLVRLLGPRRARTWVQIIGGVLGALVYVMFQSGRFVGEGERNWLWNSFKDILTSAPGLVVARAGRGSAWDLLVLVTIALGCISVSVRLLSHIFLTGIQQSGTETKKRKRTQGVHRIRAGAFRAMFFKDLRLIRRDPLLLSQLIPSIMYVLPMFFGFRAMGGIHLLAPLSVLVIVQFSLLLVTVAVDGEECLDLIRSSPLLEVRLRTAKMAAGMVVPSVIALVLCGVLIATGTPGLAAIALITGIATAAACCWVRSAHIRPTARTDLLKKRGSRGSGSTVLNLSCGFLMLLATSGVGVIAAGAFPLVGVLILGITALGVIACFTFVTPQELA